ncbi:hypothetical protein Daura_02100 [Dactylosporangium aurantiacum]|uniref:Uncharacterized protein n=1 Tax=Dactylosporangium aurantiacum TaxID=35754 RepID=A0A9Q9IFG7_9ACTN|nr:hypothetical protein [Dactylosporangium aurantiacum]MDG6100843.1 hypothetical protein [Dactylosporangium aurantiacum]UWZ55097.1 hypothetical protein Daura_02100 [Dactylosporangium aurantiacum]
MPDSLAPDVAEQLLDLREPDDGQYTALTALLVAAAGPARPAELSGEDSALRAYRLAYRARRKRRAGLLTGVAVMVLSVGGTAYAAGGDYLPEPVQRTMEALFGAKNPAPSAVPGASGSPGTSSPPPLSSPPPAAVPAGRVEQLCRAWEASRTDPRAPQVSGEERRELTQAAKGTSGIDDYCRALLGGSASTTAPGQTGSAAQPATPGATPHTTPPGKPVTTKSGNGQPGAGASRTHPARPARS